MTHARAFGSVEGTLHEVLRQLSDAEIEAATNKRRNAFYKKANPLTRDHLSLQDAGLLDRALIAKKLAPRFLPLLQELVGPAPETPALAIDRALRLVTGELGDLTRAVDVALTDGKLELPEQREIAREAHELGTKAFAVRDLVGGKPILGLVGEKS